MPKKYLTMLFLKKRCNESTLTLRWVNFSPVYNPRLRLLASRICCMCNNSVSPRFASKTSAVGGGGGKGGGEMSTGPEGGGGGEEIVAVLECLFSLFFQKNIFAHIIYDTYMSDDCLSPLFGHFLCKGLGEFQQIQVHVGKVQRQHISISFFLACCNRYIRHAVVSLFPSSSLRWGIVYVVVAGPIAIDTLSFSSCISASAFTLQRLQSGLERFLFLANVFTYFWNGMTPILERHLNAVTALWWLFWFIRRGRNDSAILGASWLAACISVHMYIST